MKYYLSINIFLLSIDFFIEKMKKQKENYGGI